MIKCKKTKVYENILHKLEKKGLCYLIKGVGERKFRVNSIDERENNKIIVFYSHIEKLEIKLGLKI